MKPLVLRTYEISGRVYMDEISSDFDLSDLKVIPEHLAQMIARGKRLTNAECAAEYWKARDQCLIEVRTNVFELDETMAETLHRFATLPHAAERNYQ